jgi:hypothetical protein
MPPLYGLKSIMNYLQLKRPESFYKRLKLGLPCCKIEGRIESSTEMIDEWRYKLVMGKDNKYCRRGVKRT